MVLMVLIFATDCRALSTSSKRTCCLIQTLLAKVCLHSCIGANITLSWERRLIEDTRAEGTNVLNTCCCAIARALCRLGKLAVSKSLPWMMLRWLRWLLMILASSKVTLQIHLLEIILWRVILQSLHVVLGGLQLTMVLMLLMWACSISQSFCWLWSASCVIAYRSLMCKLWSCESSSRDSSTSRICLVLMSDCAVRACSSSFTLLKLS